MGLATGGALSGAAMGLLVAVVPWPRSAVSTIIAAVLAFSLAIYDLMVPAIKLPQRRSLIPQEVFYRSHALGFLRFGMEFGSGVRTFVTSASPYILIVMMLSVPTSFAQVVGVGVAFGVGRSVGPLQAILADDVYWSGDLAMISRLIERVGSGLAATVAVIAVLPVFG